MEVTNVLIGAIAGVGLYAIYMIIKINRNKFKTKIMDISKNARTSRKVRKNKQK